MRFLSIAVALLATVAARATEPTLTVVGMDPPALRLSWPGGTGVVVAVGYRPVVVDTDRGRMRRAEHG